MPSIHQQLIIGASAEKVYQTISSQEGLSGWWTPETIVKPEVGSIARFAFGNYFKEMKITTLKSPEQVEWLCVAGADEWIGTTISFKLEGGDKKSLLSAHPEMGDQLQQQKSDGAVTLLTLQHNDWKAYTPMYAECSYTWGQFMRSVKLLCETGKGISWPMQHQI